MINPTPYNSTQLALLRSENQLSRLYLAVLDAPQVFACQINQDFDTHDMVAQAAYDNPVGNYADVLPGQTALIGSAPGLADLGACRIRKPLTSSQLYFGETSEIAWANNLHVTVVDELALWARHIRIVDDVPLMDYDVAYANQHSVCDPVPVLGPHAVAWLEDDEESVPFDAGPSWVIGSTISAYAWSVSPAAGISISDPASATPIFTISQPGTYRVRGLVTAANGASFAGYRYIFAFDDEHPAFSEFALKSCLGDDETGGWSFKIATPSAALAQALQPGRLVVLFERAMYGNQAGSVGAIAGRENILATGWVTGFDDKEIDPEQDGYTFDIQGAHWWLKQMPVFPFGLELKNGTPTSWTEMQELTVDKALWHLLHWRSTATAIMDVVLTGDTRYAKELSAVSGALWEQIEAVAKASILAQPFVNQLGQMFVKIPVNLTPLDARAGIPNILDIQPGDRAKSLSLPRARQAKVAQLDLLGVAVSSTGAGSAYRSLANGNVPRRTGSKTIRDNLLLGSQAKANELAGLLMADMNNPYPSIPVRLKANLRGFDMAPPMTASISLPDYTGKIVPKRAEYRHNETTGKLDVEVEFRAETDGTLSITGELPQPEAPIGGIIFPPPPTVPPLPPPPSVTVNIGKIYILIHNGLYVLDSLTPPYTWRSLVDAWSFSGSDVVAAGLDKLRVDRVSDFVAVRDPLGNNIYASQAGEQLYLKWRGPDYIVEGSGATFVDFDIHPLTGQFVFASRRTVDESAFVELYAWAASNWLSAPVCLDQIGDIVTWNDNRSKITVRDGIVLFSSKTNLSAQAFMYIGGEWTQIKRSDGSTGQAGYKSTHRPIGYGRNVYMMTDLPALGSEIYKLDNFGSLTPALIGTFPASAQNTDTFVTSEDGQKIMLTGTFSTFAENRYWLSLDGGLNWAQSAEDVLSRYNVFVTGSTWIRANNQGVYITEDDGETWLNVTGNLYDDFKNDEDKLVTKGIDFTFGVQI